ncbi:MAG: cytochrome c [Nitrospira sp.]|nr:cytochrome c [Nitrospira sp.]
MKLTLAVAIILLAAAPSWIAAQVLRGNPKAGETVYQQQCLRCHGANLDGNGPDSRDLIVPPADLRSPASRSKTDWELLVAISNGVLFSPMHSFRGTLTDEQMLDVLSYIRFMSPPDITS